MHRSTEKVPGTVRGTRGSGGVPGAGRAEWAGGRHLLVDGCMFTSGANGISSINVHSLVTAFFKSLRQLRGFIKTVEWNIGIVRDFGGMAGDTSLDQRSLSRCGQVLDRYGEP